MKTRRLVGRLLLPESATFSIKPADSGSVEDAVTFSFSEHQPHATELEIQNTVDVMRRFFEGLDEKATIRCDLKKRKIHFRMIMSRKQAADFIVSEFMPWSNASDLTLGQMFSYAACAALTR